MYERILVALDGTEIAERVLPHAEALARAFGSTLILLRVTTPPEKLMAELSGGMDVAPSIVDPTEILDDERAEIADYLDSVAGRLRGAGLTVQTDEQPGAVANEIVQRATDLKADLIAMTSHARSGLGRLIFGNVGESVLRHATIPLLLVHVKDEDDDEKGDE
jgi:nucleotide-binding universal stress UspA family protein